MKIEETKLKNGAKIIGIHIPGSSSVFISFGFRVGSRGESKSVAGITHFLEHMMFKGSVKRPSAEAISRAADSIGGQQNAYTGKEFTAYYIKASRENFDEALDIVGDMVTRPLLLDNEVKKEMNTIIQEAKMYEDNPSMSIVEATEESIFGDNSLGWNIVGFPKSIRAVSGKSLRSYYKKHYNGSNARVVISGNLPKDYIRKVKKYASLFPAGERSEWKPARFNSQKLLLRTKAVEQAHIGFALPGFDLSCEKAPILQVTASILGGYMSARLFTEIREKRGWAYQIIAYSDELTNTGYFGVIGGVRKNKAFESLEVIKKEVLNFSRTVTEEEVRRAIENIKGSSVLRYDTTGDIGDYVMKKVLLSDKVELPNEYLKKISRVTRLAVINVAEEVFREDKIHLAIIGPFKDKQKFAKILNQK